MSDKLCRHLRTFCYSTDKTRRRDQSSGKTCRSDKTYRRDETCWSDKTCRRDETCWSDKMCRRDKSVSQHIRCLQRYMISTTFLSYCLAVFAVIPLSSFSLSLFMYFLYFYYYYFIFNVYHLSNLCFGDLLTFSSLPVSLQLPSPQRHQSTSEDLSVLYAVRCRPVLCCAKFVTSVSV